MTNNSDDGAPADEQTNNPSKAASLALGDTAPSEPGSERNNPLGLVVLAGLLALLWFGAGPRYFLVVLGLIIMIFLHELGHFMTARWTGMKATEFFLGFGPRIWSFRRGETEYGLRSIPAGAFVRIVGMNNLDPVEPADAPRAYKNATYPRRMLVITAGSMMHFIQAVLLFALVTSVVGLADSSKPWTISALSQLEDGSPAPAVGAGLQPGDTIVTVDGRSTVPFSDLQSYLQGIPGEEVTLVVEREGETFETVTVLATVPQSDGTEYGFLGVSPSFERTTVSPVRAVEEFAFTLEQSVIAIPRFFSPSTLANLGTLVFEERGQVDLDSDEAAERPISLVGAVRIAGNPDFDWAAPLLILASINVFVGVINLVPLLPLDGGHAAIATYERIRSRNGRRYEMDVAKLLPLTYAVVALLGFIFVSTLWLDVFRPIG